MSAQIGKFGMNGVSGELSLKLERLRGIFAPMRSVMVAFSGGVDSTFVLRVAHDVLGARMLALTTTSPTMPDDDRRSALEMARMIGARHQSSTPTNSTYPATPRIRSTDATCASTTCSRSARLRRRSLESKRLPTDSTLTTCMTIAPVSKQPAKSACAIRWSRPN